MRRGGFGDLAAHVSCQVVPRSPTELERATVVHTIAAAVPGCEPMGRDPAGAAPVAAHGYPGSPAPRSPPTCLAVSVCSRELVRPADWFSPSPTDFCHGASLTLYEIQCPVCISLVIPPEILP